MKVVTDAVVMDEARPNDIFEIQKRYHTAHGTHAIILRDTFKTVSGYRVLSVGSVAGARLFEYSSSQQAFKRIVLRKLDKGENIKLIVE